MYPTRSKGPRSCDELMPVESASIVVRKVPLHVTKEQMEQIFLRAGAIKYVYFPKVPRHFTTKYCFIKYHDIRRAREAQQLFDGYRLGDQWLQVVAYDPTYKFRHSSSSQSVTTTFDDAPSRPRPSSTTGHSSAHQPLRQIAKPLGTPTSSRTPSRSSSPTVAAPARFVRSQQTLPTSKPSFLDQPPRYVESNGISEISNDLSESDDDENSDSEGEYGNCRAIDIVLLDSEVGFWTWLEQRLRSVGPLHYKTSEIDNVLMKLPGSARKQFSWPLGAFRLRDKDRFHMIGPFLCLPEQVPDAKAKCLAMCCNWRAPFSEFWEPVPPSEIRNSSQLIQYLRKMLIHFGPQSMDDLKIRQLLHSLSPEMRANSECILPTTSSSGFVEFLESPNARKIFGISGTVFYLNQEHTHILRSLSTDIPKCESGQKSNPFVFRVDIPDPINERFEMMDQQASLKSAQKLDPAISQIIGQAGQVAIYYFSERTKNWEKSENEGPLIICQRKQAPEYCFVVLNQTKPENYRQVMDPGMSLQRKGEYLLYKPPSAPSVQAIWFYSEQDCIKIFDLVKGVLDNARARARAQASQPVTSSPSQKAVKEMGKDIITMLSNATNARKETGQQASQQTYAQAARQAGGDVIDVHRPNQASHGAPLYVQPSQPSVQSNQLEHLFKSVDPARNGNNAVIDQPKNVIADIQGKDLPISVASGGYMGLSSLPGPAGLMNLGKGRGRPPDLAPAVQRLLLPGGGVAGVQQQSSAFTNVTSPQRTVSGSTAPTSDSQSASSASLLYTPLISSAGMNRSLGDQMFSPTGAPMQQMKDELLTPADLGATDGADTGAFNQAAAALTFSPASAVNATPPHQGISTTASSNLIMGQTVYNYEQFRQSMVYLLEHDDDFGKRLFDAFLRASAQRFGN